MTITKNNIHNKKRTKVGEIIWIELARMLNMETYDHISPEGRQEWLIRQLQQIIEDLGRNAQTYDRYLLRHDYSDNFEIMLRKDWSKTFKRLRQLARWLLDRPIATIDHWAYFKNPESQQVIQVYHHDGAYYPKHAVMQHLVDSHAYTVSEAISAAADDALIPHDNYNGDKFIPWC